MKTTRLATALVAGMTVLLIGSVALAQDKKKEDGYGYEFTDDPLNAGGFGPSDATQSVDSRQSSL